MNKYKEFSKEVEALSVKDFVDKVDRLLEARKKRDALLEKRLGAAVADSAIRFMENNPQFTEEEVAELFETPM